VSVTSNDSLCNANRRDLDRVVLALVDGKELIAAQSFKELPAEAFATPKRRQNEAESSAGAFSRCYV
jgi:hypothetical protein